MSYKNPGARSSGKRRKVEEGSCGSKEGDTSPDLRGGPGQGEETIDPFHSPKGFDERAKSMTAKVWVRACESLMAQSEERETMDESVLEGFCARCRDMVPEIINPISAQLAKTRYALREYSRRYLRTLRDVNSEREGKEETVTRSVEREKGLGRLVERLTKEREETELERDQLRTALATKEEDHQKETKRLVEERREAELERDRLRTSLTTTEDQLRAALAAREKESGREGTPPPPDTVLEEVEMREGASPLPLPLAGKPSSRPSWRPSRDGSRRSGPGWSYTGPVPPSWREEM